VQELAVGLDMRPLVMLRGDVNLHAPEGGAQDLVHTHATEHLEQVCPFESPAVAIKQLKNAIVWCSTQNSIGTNTSKSQKYFRKCPGHQNVGIFKLKFKR
jgi:hypothetical protein